MRIVIDARESGTSTGRYADKLIEHLHILKPKHEIVLLAKTHRLEFLREIAPTFTVIETPFKEFTFGEQIGFKRQLENLRADLVHFSMVQQPILYRGTVVTTMHDLIMTWENNPARNLLVHRIKQQVYKWMNKRAARKSNYVIVPTEYVKGDVTEFTHVNPDKIVVTYEAADFTPYKPTPVKTIENKQFIMYVGRPMPHKNLERLIQAFAILHKTRPELHLVLVGKTDSNYEQHAAYVKEHHIQNVIFTGFTSDAQLRWLYEHTVAYTFPSLSEGFGLPALEAMAHGAPVVASNATCIPEVCGYGAYYFDPLDIEEMATKIGEVVDDPILREDLIELGKKQVTTYSWDRMAKQTLAVYEQALDHTP